MKHNKRNTNTNTNSARHAHAHAHARGRGHGRGRGRGHTAHPSIPHSTSARVHGNQPMMSRSIPVPVPIQHPPIQPSSMHEQHDSSSNEDPLTWMDQKHGTIYKLEEDIPPLEAISPPPATAPACTITPIQTETISTPTIDINVNQHEHVDNTSNSISIELPLSNVDVHQTPVALPVSVSVPLNSNVQIPLANINQNQFDDEIDTSAQTNSNSNSNSNSNYHQPEPEWSPDPELEQLPVFREIRFRYTENDFKEMDKMMDELEELDDCLPTKEELELENLAWMMRQNELKVAKGKLDMSQQFKTQNQN
jgi:hypothetical protein